jgi:membrane protein YdbS with pleckstrin-like domain
MDNKKRDSIDGVIATLLFLTIAMLVMKWEWYLDIPYWVVFAPIYLPIIVVALVVAILSIIEPKQNKK